MKVKEVSRTANTAWSPPGIQSIHLACGTVAQQLDATFSTSAKLEVFSLDLETPGHDMTLVGAIETPHRFHKLVWSGHGMDVSHPLGLVMGGSDNGVITIWSADRIIKSGDDCTVASINQHTGAVRALDVNPFQPNLLASGASESEIFIWDLNNPSTPMSPGSKTHPLDDVSGVAWNCQVQHILASTSSGGRSVVWDLRKNEPIIQVADSSSRIQSSGIAWHPDVATQLVTSSVDDRSPVIQMWDLRFATSPMRILEQHQRGVLSMAWCRQDSDLLLSAAKDNRVLCWNPNSELPGGEVVYELPSTTQWIFECQWCPRNPGIISTASFDGHVTVYSLLGGGAGGVRNEEEVAEAGAGTETVLSSGGDFFDGAVTPISPRGLGLGLMTRFLKIPPKWFRRPCGASFAFGGKLVAFTNTRGAGVAKTVSVSRVVTEQDFLQKSSDLEKSLAQKMFAEFCEGKVADSTSATNKSVWGFLKVTFEENPRRQYLNLLGYDVKELEKNFATWSKMRVSTLPSAGGLDVSELSQKLATIPLTRGEGEETQDETISEASSNAAVFGSEYERRGSTLESLNEAASASLSKNISSVSIMAVPVTPPSSTSTSLFSIPTDRDTDGMLAKALLVGNFESAVDICISADRMAEAMVLAVAGGSDLLKRTQQVFFHKKPSKVSKLISAVVNRNWTEISRYGDLENWREILAALVTYAGPEDFAPLCDLLGNRLEKEMDGKYRDQASLCYICSGNVEKFVESLSVSGENQALCDTPLTLQATMEKVVLLRRAVELQRKQYEPSVSERLSTMLRQYASILASQGALETAYSYLVEEKDSTSAILKYRLYHSQGLTSNPRPENPYPLEDITPTHATPTHAKPSAVMQVDGGGVLHTSQQTNRVHQNTAQFYGRGRAPKSGDGDFAGTVGTQGTFVGQATANPTPIPTASLYGAHQQGTQPSVSNPGIFNPMAVPTSETTPMAPPSNTVYQTETKWNDPPILRKKATIPATANVAAPNTAPIMSPLQSRPEATPSTMESVNQKPSPSPAQKKGPPPVIEKPPIPQEYDPLVQAFEEMLKRCRGAAANLGTRKKVDDIEKKLSVLFDLLRENQVSANVIQGLNFMAQGANNRDYQSGLGCYNQMVSSVNFAEISGFMPGIKTLFNLGIQLRV